MTEADNFGFGDNPDIDAAIDTARERTEFSPDLKQDPRAISWLAERLSGVCQQQLQAEDAEFAGEGYETSFPLTETEAADIRVQLIWELAQLSQGASVEDMLYKDVFNAVNLAALLEEYYNTARNEGLNA